MPRIHWVIARSVSMGWVLVILIFENPQKFIVALFTPPPNLCHIQYAYLHTHTGLS
jgi:hypothetical protein